MDEAIEKKLDRIIELLEKLDRNYVAVVPIVGVSQISYADGNGNFHTLFPGRNQPKMPPAPIRRPGGPCATRPQAY